MASLIAARLRGGRAVRTDDGRGLLRLTTPQIRSTSALRQPDVYRQTERPRRNALRRGAGPFSDPPRRNGSAFKEGWKYRRRTDPVVQERLPRPHH